MKYLKPGLICLATIMFSSFLSAFSFSEPEPELANERRVDLSGNYFTFAMPVNFSKDMPANDLIEKVSLSDQSFFQPPQYGSLLKRWWDIREPGFFGKNLVTVMMDIAVRRTPENIRYRGLLGRDYNLSNRLDLILALDEQAINTYKETGGGDVTLSAVMNLISTKPETMYHDELLNGQVWTSYTVALPDNVLIVNFCLPLSSDVYLETSFSYSPNDNTLPRTLYNQAEEKITLPIINSFFMQYRDDNIATQNAQKLWLEVSTQTTIKDNFSQLLMWLYKKTPEQLEHDVNDILRENEKTLQEPDRNLENKKLYIDKKS